MRLQHVISVLGSGLLCLASGCGTHTEPSLIIDLQQLNNLVPNDNSVNGISVNGLSVNGISVNGLSVNGISVNGLSVNSSGVAAYQTADARPIDLGKLSISSLTLDGKRIEDATINGSALSGKLNDRSISGAGLIGAQLTGSLLNGTSIPLRIEDATTDESGVWLYSVSVLSDNGPMPLCGLANGTPIPAIAVRGYWDKAASYVDESDNFTFGCINAAVGKCARWGYQPWATAQECRNNSCKTRTLADWHRACVRLVRADYCGDGVSHTRSGTRINVYDQLGIQKTASPGWEVEAEWGKDGASCIGHTRWVQANPMYSESDLAYVQRVCPDRLAATKPQKCDLDKTTYNTQFGFNKSSDERPLVRNESPQYQ